MQDLHSLVSTELPSLVPWVPWIIAIATSIIAITYPIVSVFVLNFVKKKAEQLATKSDIAELTHTVKQIEAIYARDVETHKVELLKSKVIYEERLKAYSKLVGLIFEIQPDLPHPYADQEDFVHQLGKTLVSTRLKIKSYMVENAAILPPNVRDLIVRTYSNVEDGLFEPPSENASTRAFWENLKAADTAFRESLNLGP